MTIPRLSLWLDHDALLLLHKLVCAAKQHQARKLSSVWGSGKWLLPLCYTTPSFAAAVGLSLRLLSH